MIFGHIVLPVGTHFDRIEMILVKFDITFQRIFKIFKETIAVQHLIVFRYQASERQVYPVSSESRPAVHGKEGYDRSPYFVNLIIRGNVNPSKH